MWNKDKDSGKWLSVNQSINKDIYDGYKQDQIKVRMYSKCLSGAVYFPANDINNLYTMSKYRNKYSWYYGTNSPYAIQQLPARELSLIDQGTISNYKSYTRDYGMTVKNLFTPGKLIDSSFLNFYNVDVATTEYSDMLASMIIDKLQNLNLYIDGVRIVEGHTILIKDLYSIVALPNSVNPETFFKGNYYMESDFNPSSVDYKYFNEYNGIYKYKDGFLVNTDIFANYDTSFNLSVVPKMGEVNIGKQFHLSRLLNGIFPIENDPIEFQESKNWIIRNILDYNNIFDVVLNDVISTNSQSIPNNDIIYTIEPRIISIGEFGTIINTELVNGTYRSHLIHTKYRETLNSIYETNRYYWTCGKVGTLIKIDKLTFDIESIDLGISTDLNKVHFYNALNGVVVGDFGTVFITNDGGVTWSGIKYEQLDDFMFLDVVFHKLNQIFITGAVGTFVELNISNGIWKPWVKKLITTIDYYDEHLLYGDVTCIKYVNSPINIHSQESNTTYTISEYFLMGTSDGQLIIKTLLDDSEFIFLKLENVKNIRGLADTQTPVSLFIITDTVISLELTDVVLTIGGNYSAYKLQSDLTLVLDKYINAITIDSNYVISCGNVSGIYRNLNNGTDTTALLIDGSYGQYDKSKLLFLDYGISSKLNFFTDSGEYVLPTNVVVQGPIEKMRLVNIDGEQSWFNYHSDVEKDVKFYSPISDSNIVKYSSLFDKVIGTYPLDTIISYTNDANVGNNTTCLITNDISKFSQLLPNLESSDSGFSISNPKLTRNASGVFPASAHDLFNAHTFCIMLYKYIMVVKIPSGPNSVVGDVFYFDNQYVSTTLILNRIHTHSGYDYLYFNTNFNESMINSIVVSYDTTSFTNLNKFYTNIDLVDRISKHPLSIGYNFIIQSGGINIGARFNNKTAYYNMQTKIDYINDQGSGSIEILYSDAFIKFGYSPTYNVLNYLNNIDSSVFIPEKIFTAMPLYEYIPLNASNSSDADNIFIDFGRVKTNTISFGHNLEFEWDTLWLHTFVDIELVYTNSVKSISERMLIVKKYELDGRFIIELDKALVYTNGSSDFVSVSIKSRNTLEMISDDLQLMNNIQRSSMVKHIGSSYVTNMENDLSSKFPTDSYAKILLSDYDIKDRVSGLIYVDYNSNLAFNVINVEHNTVLKINNAYNVGINVAFTTTKKHGIKVGDYVIISKNNGFVDDSWLGFVSITAIIDEHTFVTNKQWGSPIGSGCTADVYFVESDPFLNYQPVDIMELGLDVAPKQAVELKPRNMKITGDIVSLVGVDYTKFRYTCVDGLSLAKIASDFSWILNADISNAVIGQNSSGLVWYSGRWNDGRWFGSEWISGEWISGDWYQGTWNSQQVLNDNVSINITKIQDVLSSKWYSGRWFDGTWNGGSWFGGRRYGGIWNGGIWNGGIWNEGTWNSGLFSGGIWVAGIWNGGRFNMDRKPSYWLNGKWQGGDFESGRWFNGEFSEKSSKSRFGTLSTNTKQSLWDSGSWIGGEFHSNLTTTDDGVTIQSDIHRFSYWKTGTWGGGKFYGGTAYNIRFKSGDWYGGVSDDLEIVNASVLMDNINEVIPKIRINGVMRFNRGDELCIMGNSVSSIGTTENPLTYTVISSETDGISYTDVYVVSMNLISEKFKSSLLLKMMDYILRKGGSINPLIMSVVIHNNVTHVNETVNMSIYEYLELCVAEDIDMAIDNDPDYISIINPLILESIRLLLTSSVGDIDMDKMDTGMRLVSKFTNSNWHSGVWYNGVFESGSFDGGIWYDGKFTGEWGKQI